MAAAAQATAPGSGRWLFGPLTDLLLGCGLLYVLLFAASGLLGPELRASQAAFLFPLLVLLLSTPHYGATLLRVYEQRNSRRAYALFAVWASLAVFAFFVVSVHHRGVAAWLLTIYLTWSPWHYTGQNYGLAVMFLRRRGVGLEARTKRLLYASFLLSYALVFLMMHADGRDALDRPLADQGPAVAFVSLGIPWSFASWVVPALLAGNLAALAAAGGLLLRRASARDLAPTAALALTQALWFTAPFAANAFGWSPRIEAAGWDRRYYYLSWIVAGHAVQYLWVTTYYARASPGWNGYARYLGKALVCGLALWTLPAVIFSRSALGGVGYAAGLGLLVAAAVNIHHFILDGAIWKLRHSRIASVLIRSEPEAADASGGRLGLVGKLTWGVATAGFALGVFFFWAEEIAFPAAMARRDYAAAREVRDGLALFGRDNAMARARIRRAEQQQEARALGGAPIRDAGGPRTR